MLILGLDFETTGLLPQADRIIEVGAVLYDWDTETPLRLLSELIQSDRPIPDEIVTLTGITDTLLAAYGKPENDVLDHLLSLTAQADFVMAHNGSEFDRLFFDAWMARLRPTMIGGVPWLASRLAT